MIRDDLSDRLVHLTRGDSHKEAGAVLTKILKESRLLGGDGYIKGRYKCVCFSEAPIAKLGMILATEGEAGHYAPYGIMVSKQWLYDRRGRPVIYQPHKDYELLPEELRYRHVRFDPPGVDLTSEREWRIKIGELKLEPKETTVVVPDREWVDRMKDEQTKSVQRRVGAMGGIGGAPPSDVITMPWHFIALEDLGVPMP